MWKSPSTMVVVALAVLCQQIRSVESFAKCVSRTRINPDEMGFDTTTLLKEYDDDGDESKHVGMGRNRFLESSGSVLTMTMFAAFFAIPTSALALSSYSSNARNMERLSSGDLSGGSIYDNYPKTEASKKRRAMQGCKIPSARRAAAQEISQEPLNEKDCNMRIMGGETDFMLQAMRKLDCPTCPYGIDPK